MYAQGMGVPQLSEEAFRWFERAALSGYAPAENDLASLLFAGFGTPMDKDAAMSWWRKAAEQGLTDAQVNLAIGVASQNSANADVVAFRSFKKAAKRDDARGQF